MNGKKIGEGALLKDRSVRPRPIVDYKAMQAGKKSQKDNVKSIGTGCVVESLRGVPAAEAEGATGSDRGHESEQLQLLADLDNTIAELESSLVKVNSQLKQASLRKEKRERMDRVDKLKC